MYGKAQIRHPQTTCHLRAYQSEALKAVLDAYKAGKRRVIVSLPTGTGKTVVFAHFPRVLNMRKRLLVLAHREELLLQARDEFRFIDPELKVEIEQAGTHASAHAKVVIASVPTLARSGVAGDRTAETFLNAMDATGGEKVWSKRRVRMEHGDGLLPDLFPRAKRLGVVVVQNPIHFTFGELFVKRFGEKRAHELQPLHSLLDAGIPLAIGSDGPVNPFLNIMLASTFSRNPSEALTREQAVTAYTLTSAYAEFAEKDKGSLEPGKLADLAILSQDIFKIRAGNLPTTESVMTLVGGKIVYDAKVITLR
jgi:hypothetical protein